MVQRVAITGASGFAGRHVAPLLLSSGMRLRALARDPAKAPAGVDAVTGDLQNSAALDELCRGADAVVHLAGAISAPDRAGFLAVNVEGTRNIAAAATRAGIRRFIHVSSLAAREPELSAYAASKRAGEEIVAQLAGSFSLAVLRPPAVYGPGDRATLPLMRQLAQRIAIIPGRRDSRFSLIYAADLARFINQLLGSNWTGIAEIDDGAPGGYAWTDLARLSAEAEGHRVSPLFLPRMLLAAIARLVPATGLTRDKLRELYHPDWVVRGAQPPLADRIGFRRGFAETVQWYRAQGWLPPKAGAHKRRQQDRGETIV